MASTPFWKTQQFKNFVAQRRAAAQPAASGAGSSTPSATSPAPTVRMGGVTYRRPTPPTSVQSTSRPVAPASGAPTEAEPAAPPKQYYMRDRTQPGAPVLPVNIEPDTGFAGTLSRILMAGSEIPKQWITGATSPDWAKKISKIVPLAGSWIASVANGTRPGSSDDYRRIANNPDFKLSEADRSNMLMLADSLDRNNAVAINQRNDVDRIWNEIWNGEDTPRPQAKVVHVPINPLQTKSVVYFSPDGSEPPRQPDGSYDFTNYRTEEDVRDESAAARAQAYSLLREPTVENEEQIRSLLRQAQELDKSIEIYDPSGAYGFTADKERAAAFREAMVDVEFQKGAPLTRDEIVALKQPFLDPWDELPGDIFLDLYNFVPADLIVEPLKWMKKGLVQVGGKLVDAVGQTPAKPVADLFRWMTAEASSAAAERVGFQTYNQVADPLARSASLFREGEDSFLVQLEHAAEAARSGDYSKLPASVGSAGHEALGGMANVIDPDDWGRIAEEAADTLRKNVYEAELNRLIVKKVDPDAAVEIAGELADAYVANSRNVARAFADQFTEVYLAAHKIPGTNILDDTLAGVTVRALPETSGLRKAVIAADSFASNLSRKWTQLVLAARPGWVVNNYVDSNLRYLINGGSILDDMGSIADTVLDLEKAGVPVPSEFAHVFARTELPVGDDVVSRILTGWKPQWGPLSYIRSEWGRLRDVRAIRILEQAAGDAVAVDDLIRAGATGREGLRGKVGGIVGDAWGAWIGGWKDYSSGAIEFPLRLRLYYRQVSRNLRTLEAVMRPQVFSSLPDSLKPLAESFWREAGGDAEKLRQLVSEYLGAAAKGSPAEWSPLYSPTLKDDLLTMRPEDAELFSRHVLSGLRELRAQTGLTPESIKTFFSDVRRQIDELAVANAAPSEFAQAAQTVTRTAPGVDPTFVVRTSKQTDEVATAIERLIPSATRSDFDGVVRVTAEGGIELGKQWGRIPANKLRVAVRDAVIESAERRAGPEIINGFGGSQTFQDYVRQFIFNTSQAVKSNTEWFKTTARLFDENPELLDALRAVTRQDIDYEPFLLRGSNNFRYEPVDILTEEGRKLFRSKVEADIPNASPAYRRAGEEQARARRLADEAVSADVLAGKATPEVQAAFNDEMRAWDKLQSRLHDFLLTYLPGPRVATGAVRGKRWDTFFALVAQHYQAGSRWTSDLAAAVRLGANPNSLNIEQFLKLSGIEIKYKPDGFISHIRVTLPNGKIITRGSAHLRNGLAQIFLEDAPPGMKLKDVFQAPWMRLTAKPLPPPASLTAETVGTMTQVAEETAEAAVAPVVRTAKAVEETLDPIYREAVRFEVEDLIEDVVSLTDNGGGDWLQQLRDEKPWWNLIWAEQLPDVTREGLVKELRRVADGNFTGDFAARVRDVLSQRLLYGEVDALGNVVIPPNPYVLKQNGLPVDQANELWAKLFGVPDAEKFFADLPLNRLREERDAAWQAFVNTQRSGGRSLSEMWGEAAGTYDDFVAYLNDLRDKVFQRHGDRAGDLVQSLDALLYDIQNFRTATGKALQGVLPDDLFRRISNLNRRYPVSIPLFKVTDDVRTWLNRTEDVLSQLDSTHRALDNWERYLADQLGADSRTMRFAAPTADEVTSLSSWMEQAVELRRSITDVAVSGGELGGVKMDGALPFTQQAMLDYTSFNRFDQLMKNVFPFWMFPSRSLPYWLEYMAAHPWLPAAYDKYNRYSNYAARQAGLMTSSGDPLPSTRGYFPIPGTSIWINPAAPLSFRYAIPRTRYYDDSDGKDAGPLQQLYAYLYEMSGYYGFSMSPWITITAGMTGVTDLQKTSAWSIIPQIDLVPPWIERDVMEKVARFGMPGVKDFWYRTISPEPVWKDYLIERQLLYSVLERTEGMDDAQALAILAQAKQALIDREKSDLWLAARQRVDESEYSRSVSGYFTGMFPREYTDAAATLTQIRNDLNVVRDALNDRAQVVLFDLDEDAEQRWQSYLDRRYQTPEGRLTTLYNTIRYVRTPEGEPAYGEERRNLITQSIHEDTVTQAYYDALNQLQSDRDQRLRALPVGSDSKLSRQIWQEYFNQRTAIESDRKYDDARRGWTVGLKPDEVLANQINSQWMGMLRETEPKWDRENESYADYQQRLQEWEAQLPATAAQLWEAFRRSTEQSARSPEELKRVMQTLDQMRSGTTLDTYRDYQKQNDSPMDALNAAWRALYWEPFWDAVRDKKGYERELAERNFLEAHPNPPSAQQLAGWVAENYGDKFDPKILLEIANTNPITTIEERNAPEDDLSRMKEEAYNILSWAGPGNGRRELIDEYVRLGGDRSDLDVWYETGGAWRDESKLPEFIERLKEASVNLGLQSPSSDELQRWIVVSELNDRFRQEVAAQFGDDIWAVIAEYGGASSSKRRTLRKADPRIDAYYKFRDRWGEEYPDWSAYYQKDSSAYSTTAASGGGGSSGRRSGGGGGGYQSGDRYIAPRATAADVQRDVDSILRYVEVGFEASGGEGFDFKNDYLTHVQSTVIRSAMEKLGQALNGISGDRQPYLDAVKRYLTALMTLDSTGVPDLDYTNDFLAEMRKLSPEVATALELVGYSIGEEWGQLLRGQYVSGGGSRRSTGRSSRNSYSNMSTRDFYRLVEEQGEAQWPGVTALWEQYAEIVLMQGVEAARSFWESNPSLALYDEFREEMQRRLKAARSGLDDVRSGGGGGGGRGGGGRSARKAVSDSFVRMGYRSTLDSFDLFDPGRMGRGGVGGIPVWTEEMMNALPDQFIQEVVSPQPLSPAAQQYLKTLEKNHPEWEEPIRAIKVMKSQVSSGSGETAKV